MDVADKGSGHLSDMWTKPDFPPGRLTNAPNLVIAVTFPLMIVPTASSIYFSIDSLRC